MKNPIRITDEDINMDIQDPLESFYSGIKARQTLETMDRALKKFLIEACSDILDGKYRQRAKQFVDIARSDQKRATAIIIAYVNQLKKRTELEKSDPNYIKPSYLPNKIKPIKKLLVMNDVGLAWNKIRSHYPEVDSLSSGRGYTRDEIRTMLSYSDSVQTDFVILASSSGGLRVGAWENQTWKNVFPVYSVNGQYKIELQPDDKATIVCAGLKVYAGTREEYVALISIEAWEKLQRWKVQWAKRVGRQPIESDPLLITKSNFAVPLTTNAIKRRMERIVKLAGIRKPLDESKTRYDVPVTHGFRRYWDKTMMNTKRSSGTLSSLVIKERLFGHYGLVKTDKNYFWTDTLELVPEYLEAMPELMISDEYRLRIKIKLQQKRNDDLEKANRENIIALRKIEELEAKVQRMQTYSVIQ